MHFTADNEPCFLGNSRTIKKQVGALEPLSYLLQKGSKFQTNHLTFSTFFFGKNITSIPRDKQYRII